jgi:hypothetical protein
MNRLLQFLSPALQKFGKLKPKLEHLVNHTIFDTAAQIGVGFLAAFLLGIVGRYLWFWVTPIGIVGGTALAFYLGKRFLSASSTFFLTSVAFCLTSTIYYVLGQPMLILILALVAGLAVGGLCAWRLKGMGRKLLGFLAGLLIAPGLVVVVVLAMYCYILPVVHPFTVAGYNLAPVLSMLPTIGLLLLADLKQPRGRSSYYWLATPVLTALFCICFWPGHTYFGMFAFVVTAVGLSFYAFRERPTAKHPGRSHRPLMATVCVAALFCLDFFVSNTWQGMYDYQMANAVSVNVIDLDQLPATNNDRLVPKLAAFDYAAGNNPEQVTKLSTTPRPIVIADNAGVSHLFWELVRYPDIKQLQNRPGLFLTHLRALTGGCEGALLVDAGERGRFGKPIDTDFMFCDTSDFTRGAFYVRHPGATLMPGMIAMTKDGKPYFVLPFVNKVLQWGAMVPEVSGIMTISPWGFIQDMLPSQAAATFPGVSFVPSELARQYADLWAKDSSWWSKHVSGDQFEVSEVPTEGENGYPYWQDFKQIGLKGVLNFEPMGAQSNLWVRIGLFDRASLSMTLVKWDPTLSLTGPKQLMKYVATQSHVGLYNVTGREPMIVVSPNHCLYIVAALTQHNSADVAYHGYSKNTVMDPHGQDYVDVDTRAEVDAAVSGTNASCTLLTAAH